MNPTCNANCHFYSAKLLSKRELLIPRCVLSLPLKIWHRASLLYVRTCNKHEVHRLCVHSYSAVCVFLLPRGPFFIFFPLLDALLIHRHTVGNTTCVAFSCPTVQHLGQVHKESGYIKVVHHIQGSRVKNGLIAKKDPHYVHKTSIFAISEVECKKGEEGVSSTFFYSRTI